MNERGFFTLIGICFLLVASILVIGLQETSKSYINVASDFKSETDLQNIADSALFEAIEIIKSPGFSLEEPVIYLMRYNNQHEIPLGNNYDADVTVFYEYGKNGDNGNIWFFTRNHSSGKPVDNYFKKEKGVILISVASRKINDDTTIYRRSMAYVLTEDNFKTIYFMNSLTD